VTPSEIELATFRLVAQCLNQLRHQQRAPENNNTNKKQTNIKIILKKLVEKGRK
jgi:hypothetical protein